MPSKILKPKVLKFTKCFAIVGAFLTVAIVTFTVAPALTCNPLSWIVVALCIVIEVTSILACFTAVSLMYGQD
jgi:hypothetical protein